MATYRKEWTDPNGTGYVYRLDIVPYNESINSTTTAISGAAATILEVGAVEHGFNDIPYGVMNPPTMSLKLSITDLPTALSDAIRIKQTGRNRNLFLFFCDRGSGGTFTLEFCGVQSKISGTTYSKEAGKYLVTVDLIDALYYGMVSTNMSALESNTLSTATSHGVLYDVGFPSATRTDSYHDARVSATGWSDKYTHHSFLSMVSLVREEISFALKTLATRTSNVVASADNTDADVDSVWGNDIIGACIEFYKCSDTYPRTKSTALTTTTTRLIAMVYEAGGTTVVGGMTSARDKYSWAGYESAWDWAKDFFETMNCKASYKPIYNAGGGNPYITWEWSCKPVLGTVSGLITLSLDSAITEPEITETEDAIGISETRIETEGDDVKAWKVNTGVSRADRSFTLRANCVNTLPTVKPSIKPQTGGDTSIGDAISLGLFQTNTLCYDGTGSAVFKVHEDVKLWKDASTATTYTADDGSINVSEEPPSVESSSNGLIRWNLWVNAVQTYGGLAYALAKHIGTIFGDDDICKFDAEFRINQNVTKVLSENLGEVYDLSSSAVASALPHLAWSTAVATAIKTDHIKNTSTITFTLVP